MVMLSPPVERERERETNLLGCVMMG